MILSVVLGATLLRAQSGVPSVALPQLAPQPAPDIFKAIREAQQLKLQRLQIEQKQMELEQRRAAIEAQRQANAPSSFFDPSPVSPPPPIWTLIQQPLFFNLGLEKLTSDELNGLNSWFTGYVNSLPPRTTPPKVVVVNGDLSTKKESIWSVKEDGKVLETLWNKEYRVADSDSATCSRWYAPFDVIIVSQGSSNTVLVVKGTDVVHATAEP